MIDTHEPPIREADGHALEADAFRAWPALETRHLDGWCLRFADGYTQRANSANVTAWSRPLDETVQRRIEAAYATRGLPPIFRLATFSPVARAADAWLQARGYRCVDPSLVMHRALGSADATDGAAGRFVRLLPDAASWLVAFRDITGQTGAQASLHRGVLEALDTPVAFAVIDAATPTRGDDAACPDACGLAIGTPGRVGLFDLATRVDRRGQGLATSLCRALMAWGRLQGAHTAWLQVVASNATARRLYEQLDFRVAYGYHYRRLD